MHSYTDGYTFTYSHIKHTNMRPPEHNVILIRKNAPSERRMLTCLYIQ